MSVIFFRCIFLYFIVIIAVRIMGKRQIGELQPAELVVTILISELAAMPMQDLNLPVIAGIIPIFALVGLELLVSMITLKSIKSRTLFYGRPIILIYKGNINQQEMARARVSVDDILEAMRNNNILSIDQVDYAILETNGQLSIFQKNINKPVTLKDMKLTPEPPTGIPDPVILDGRVLSDNLKKNNLSKKWLKDTLNTQGYSKASQVFLMTVDDNQKVYIIKKDSPENAAKGVTA